jgi:hypothetical protein
MQFLYGVVLAGNDVLPGNVSKEEEASKSGFSYI